MSSQELTISHKCERRYILRYGFQLPLGELLFLAACNWEITEMLNKDLTNGELTFSKMDFERLATLTIEIQARLDEIRKIVLLSPSSRTHSR